MKLEDVEFEVKKLELTENSVLVIKSTNIDAETIAKIRKQLGTPPKAVFGIGLEDDMYIIQVTPDSTVVISTDCPLSENDHNEIESYIKNKTFCKDVLFFDAETSVVAGKSASGISTMPPTPETRCPACEKFDHEDGGCNIYDDEPVS